MNALRVGGPLAIRCPRCGATRLSHCRTAYLGLARAPHVARVKAAPPTQEAKSGDIVLVLEDAAQEVDDAVAFLRGAAAGYALVRRWRGGAFDGEALIPARRILRLAPEDERTAAARAALAREATS